jgi:hypothetical protein
LAKYQVTIMKEGKRIETAANYTVTGRRVRGRRRVDVKPISWTAKALSYLISEDKDSNKKTFLHFKPR